MRAYVTMARCSWCGPHCVAVVGTGGALGRARVPVCLGRRGGARRCTPGALASTRRSACCGPHGGCLHRVRLQRMRRAPAPDSALMRAANCCRLLERACEVGDDVRLLDSWPERMRQRCVARRDFACLRLWLRLTYMCARDSGAPAVWLAFADAVQAVALAVRRAVHDRHEDDAGGPTTAKSMVDLSLLIERLALRIAPLVAAATTADGRGLSLATLLDTLLRHGDGSVRVAITVHRRRCLSWDEGEVDPWMVQVTDAATYSVARAVALHTVRPWLRALDAWTRVGLLPSHRHDFCVIDDVRGSVCAQGQARMGG
jgi:hypothetical protein